MKKILVLVMVLMMSGCSNVNKEILERLNELERTEVTEILTMDSLTQETMEYVVKQREDMLEEIRKLDSKLDTIDMNIDRIEDERVYMIDEVCSVRMFDDFLEDVFSISADPSLSIRIYYDTDTKTLMLYDLFGENIIEQVTIYEMFEDACN